MGMATPRAYPSEPAPLPLLRPLGSRPQAPRPRVEVPLHDSHASDARTPPLRASVAASPPKPLSSWRPCKRNTRNLHVGVEQAYAGHCACSVGLCQCRHMSSKAICELGDRRTPTPVDFRRGWNDARRDTPTNHWEFCYPSHFLYTIPVDRWTQVEHPNPIPRANL